MRVPYEIPKDTFISVIEVVPVNKKLVHHVNAQLLSYEFDKRKDVMKGEVVVDINEYPTILEAYKKLDLPNDDGSFPMKAGVVRYKYFADETSHGKRTRKRLCIANVF